MLGNKESHCKEAETRLTPKIILDPPEFAVHSESWKDNPGMGTPACEPGSGGLTMAFLLTPS